MMRYVIIAILLYVIYLVVKSIITRIPNKDKPKVENKEGNRSYDLNQVQDAEFREVKKE
jgi:hypothetical protein